MIEELKEELAGIHHKEVFQQRNRRLVGADRIPAAVLLPIFWKDGEYHIPDPLADLGLGSTRTEQQRPAGSSPWAAPGFGRSTSQG